MALWKQAVLAVLLAIVAVAAFSRVYPGADAALARLGVPQTLVRLATGTTQGDGASGETGKQAARPGNPGGGPGGGRFGAGGAGNRETLVETAPVRTATINDRISAIGDGEALRSVSLVPLVSGALVSVDMVAGAHVAEGDVLARLESRSEEVARDRAALAMKTALEKLERTRKLVTSRAASEVALNDADAEYETAKLALRDADINLQRRTIVAPIAGVVGIVPVEIGGYVTSQTEIARIDDRSAILVDFWVPERFAAMIRAGQELSAASIAIPGSSFAGKVAAVGSRVDRESRTLQIRARIDNADDLLRPGMSFLVTMKFPGEDFPAVDPLAIQWSSDGAFVWKVRDGKALREPVRIVQRNSDSVLVEGGLVAGEEVVTQGVQALRQGVALRIAGQDRAPAPAGRVNGS